MRKQWWIGSAAVLVLGCATSRMPELPNSAPHKFLVRASQYAFTTDQPLADDDPIIRDLLGLRDAVAELLQADLGNTPVRIVLFDAKDDYADFLSTNYPELPKRRAYFISRGPNDLVVLAWRGDDLRNDLRHEATHALLHACIDDIPLWLDEGLAEYFEVGPRRHAGNQKHIRMLKQSVASGWRPDLLRLEAIDDIKQMNACEYCESWLWMHFLLHHSDASRKLLADYLRELRLGKKSRLAEHAGARGLLEVNNVLAHLNGMVDDESLELHDDELYPRHPPDAWSKFRRMFTR